MEAEGREGPAAALFWVPAGSAMVIEAMLWNMVIKLQVRVPKILPGGAGMR